PLNAPSIEEMRTAAVGLALCIAIGSADIAGRPTISADANECAPPFNVGFKVVRIDRLDTAVWYPTSGREIDVTYAKGVNGRALKDGPINRCARVPLVVF